MSEYDRDWVSGYFDKLAEGEWDRLMRSPTQQVKLAVHTHYLQKHLKPGWRVLEIGAGAGRFTNILSDLGCKAVVTDISNVQLTLNREMGEQHGFEYAVESRHELDVVDMSIFEDATFDCVLCYGGPLSYVLDQRQQALTECLRVLPANGCLILSVMSLWGVSTLVYLLYWKRRENQIRRSSRPEISPL